MFRGWGKELLSSDLYKPDTYRDVTARKAFEKSLKAYMQLIEDRDFLPAFLGEVPYLDPYYGPYIEYYLQHEGAIKTLEEEILIQGGMQPEAARFILEEARKAILLVPKHRGRIWPPEIGLHEIARHITPRRLFYVIGGAAIIALNAASLGLNEPIIQISYALGGALIGKA
jgi:hypothetical protein